MFGTVLILDLGDDSGHIREHKALFHEEDFIQQVHSLRIFSHQNRMTPVDTGYIHAGERFLIRTTNKFRHFLTNECDNYLLHERSSYGHFIYLLWTASSAVAYFAGSTKMASGKMSSRTLGFHAP